jgi:hypothetical protein
VKFLHRHLFDFERAEARRNAVLLLIVAALISPDLTMPGPLPALRLEQFLLAALLPSLALYVYRHPEFRRPREMDFAFLAIGVAMAITLALAPEFVSRVTRSLRDPFELARVVQYWVMFRLGMTVLPDRSTARAIVAILCVAALALTAFSIVQYLGPRDFNGQVTSIWSDAHNLRGVEQGGRVVGTIGNANYYAIFSGLLLVMALSVLVLRQNLPGRWRWLVPATVVAATFSVVMTQSRTVTISLLPAMGVALVYVIVRKRRSASYGPAIGLFCLSLVAAVAFVQAFPPEVGGLGSRFNPNSISQDSSWNTRLSRWKSVFFAFRNEKPNFCRGGGLETIRRSEDHRVAPGGTGVAPASAEAIARDATRKQDVIRITRGVLDYFCAHNAWPAEGPLESLLVPEFMPGMPRDPGTGEPYLTYVIRGGFTIGAELENPNDPEGPIYTQGTIPNMVLNPSFEDRGSPANWVKIAGAEASTTTRHALFGNRSVEVVFAAPREGSLDRSQVFHLVIFEFPPGQDFTVNTWVRTESETPQAVWLYLVGVLRSGVFLDPFASTTVEISAQDGWKPVTVTFRAPTEDRLGRVQISLFSTTADGQTPIYFDGVSIAQGTFPPSFATVFDVDPARLRGDFPKFNDSPLIGVGPQKEGTSSRLDNEYLLFLDRYGVLGTLAYLAVFTTAFVVAYRSWRYADDLLRVITLSVLTFTLAMAVFNVAAGTWYHFQIMAIYWLLIGLLAATTMAREPARAAQPAAASTPVAVPPSRPLPEPSRLDIDRG